MAMRKRSSTTRRAVAPRRTMANRVARPWNREEITFMRKFYRNYETTWVARQLGRTVYSVRYKAVDLSIKKASPSIWRGNRGNPNTFRRPNTGWTTRKPTTRKVAKRRTRQPRTYRATSTTRMPRRRTMRTNRRTMR